MKVIIEEWDGELAIRLSDAALEALGLTIGDEVELSFQTESGEEVKLDDGDGVGPEPEPDKD